MNSGSKIVWRPHAQVLHHSFLTDVSCSTWLAAVATNWWIAACVLMHSARSQAEWSWTWQELGLATHLAPLGCGAEVQCPSPGTRHPARPPPEASLDGAILGLDEVCAQKSQSKKDRTPCSPRHGHVGCRLCRKRAREPTVSFLLRIVIELCSLGGLASAL